MQKTIRSDDENALELLTQKVNSLRESQEYMKKANQYYRHNSTMQGFDDLTELKAIVMDEQIRNRNSWDRQPYPSYSLQNNNQNIHATQRRINALEKENSSAETKRDYNTTKLGFEVLENREAMRLQLLFDGKPSESVRSQLKSNGFKWSPTNSCWQRLLNDNARHALERFITNQEKLRKNAMEM